ncbi:unnamed protein product [Didymodactylos carnosus]|uniref:DDE-1 domain-containing protein n=1 Tax=Didymodactylos carnosus TaxID=1234261 RepID=A0A8S2E3B3_9BILA|nr:unnamed protein product [Didymodactylos carnosus]CAF3814069.1 unnamed protein product [Didymodactylos carnosus]
MIDITTRMSISDESSDLDDFNDDTQQPSSNTASSPITSLFVDMQKVDDNNDRQSDKNKTKRRAWSTDEKLAAIKYYKAVKSHKQVAKKHGCSRKMIRTWVSQEQNLLLLRGEKRRKNLKRLKGAGKKLRHVQLDAKLFEWFKTKRTPPEDEQQTTTIKKDRISFRLLARQGAKICIELNTVQPPNKWYRRFLRRHRLSLQRPKRHQKIPLSEAHERIKSFHGFLRKSSERILNLRAKDSFPERDICNMDENPLPLWGDQSRASLNYVNTSNEVDSTLNSKRFCTLILCAFASDNSRVGPALIFRGKGRVSDRERSEYEKGVKVYFSPSGVINGALMQAYVQFWLSKTRDGRPKMFVTDSCSSHMSDTVKDLLKKEGVVLGIIPGDCKMYVQMLDIYVFSTLKNHYYDAAEEYIEMNAPRASIKLTANQQRILCTRPNLMYTSATMGINQDRFNGHGCNQSLCNKHWIEHRQGLSAALENCVNEHDLLKHHLGERHQPHTTIPSKDDMLKRIDHWKTKLSDKIKKSIEKGEECQIGINAVCVFTSEKVEKIESTEGEDNYNEIDIKQCLKELEKIRIDMKKQSMIIHQIIVKCIDYFRVDPMVLADHWLINGGIYYWESTKSIVKLKIEQMFYDLPLIFSGIRSKHCELSRPFLMTSKSFYGWAAGCPADVYLNGMSEKGYGGFHGILEGDLIELGINSQEHKLELDIKCRTPNKHFEISIDLQYCPFPWQIHLNMYHGEDCVRVIL